MSTKTTFKRVALVAVAALGLSLVAVTPSSAVPQVDTLSASALTATAVPGAPASVTLSHTYLSTGTGDTVTATVSIQSMPAGNTVLPVLASVTTNDTGAPTKSVVGLTASTGNVAAATAVRGDYTLSLTTLTSGTYVFTVTPQTGSKASALTLTYTIADTAVAPTTTSSRVYMRAAALNGVNSSVALLLDGGGYEQVATYSTIAPGTVTYSQATLLTNLGAQVVTQDANTSNVSTLSVAGGSTTFGNSVASFGLILGNGTAITASTISGAVQNIGGVAGAGATYNPQAGYYFNAPGFPVTVTVTGPGIITYEGSAKGKTFTEASTNANYLQKSFSLLSDGSLGTSTITFTAGGVTLGTRTVHFTGPAATITPTVAKSVIGAVATGTVITAVVKDANGLPVSGVTVRTVSSDTTKISNSYSACTAVSDANGAVSCDLTGVVAGTANITLTTNTSATDTTGISSVASAVRVGSATPTKAVVAWDSAEYLPGQAAKLTVTLTDASGLSVVDGTYTVFGALTTSNFALSSGSLPTTGATVSTVAGVASYAVNMPMTAAEIVLTVTPVTGGTIAVVAPANAPVVDKASQIAQASQDAAAEAIDAANAATDAANAAAEAADAATAAAQDAADAVAALSVQVSEQIAELKAQNDALRKQLIALTNLIIKIQKKVKA